ncbi:MAG: 3-oxoacyl-[acyl-carrier protein] reductase [bacterium]|jgi:3-oxoacyl-[acyl-carrier protein] reductase
MNDFLLNLSNNSRAKKLIQNLGLPIPMPQILKRTQEPCTTKVLADKNIALYTTSKSFLVKVLADTLSEAGAISYINDQEEVTKVFQQSGEVYGTKTHLLDVSQNIQFDALIFDATSLENIEDLSQLHDFFHPLIRNLSNCGRIIVLGRPPEQQTSIESSSAQYALNGFTRSIAKEVGKKGGTAQLFYVEDQAESRLSSPLRFFLSQKSAYITGQPIRINPAEKAPTKNTSWTSPLDQKVALVTGAARGIGAATARILASEGAKVIILDRPEDGEMASKLANELNGEALLLDITEEQAPSKIAKYLKYNHQGVDVVVHNAGITRDKTLARMSRSIWNQTLDVNLGAVNRVTSALLDGVLRDNGRIICLSSIAGIAGNMGQTNYAASKSGIIGFVQHLSKQVAERGITVNAIAPGFIETQMTAAIPFAIREIGRRLNNLNQGGQPEDVGQAITFLATPNSCGITGQVIRVCGGSLLGA